MCCWIRRFILSVGLIIIFSGRAVAYDITEAQQQMENAVSGAGGELLIGVELSAEETLWEQISRIVRNSTRQLQESWTAGLRSLSCVAVIALICGAADGIHHASGLGSSLPIVSMAGTLAIASAVLLDVGSLLAVCRETLDAISVFSKTMIPVMTTAVSLSGAPARAAAMQAATMLALDLMIQMITGVLMPAVCVYLAIMTVNYALGQQILQKPGEFILWLVRVVLKTSLTLFVSYLTISGVLGGSTDGIALKTAKAALSGTIPVVGGVISDATESLLAGAVAIRSLTGVFGILCIIAICLIPFFKIGINYVLFKGGTAMLSIFCGKELTGYLFALSESFGMLLGMLGTCAAILFFEIVFSVTLIGG